MIKKFLFILLSVLAFSTIGLASETGLLGSWSGKGVEIDGDNPAVKCDSFTFDLSREQYFLMNGAAYCGGNKYFWKYYIGVRGGDLVLGSGEPSDQVVGKITEDAANFQIIDVDGLVWNVDMKVVDGRLHYHEEIITPENVISTLDGEFERQ